MNSNAAVFYYGEIATFKPVEFDGFGSFGLHVKPRSRGSNPIEFDGVSMLGLCREPTCPGCKGLEFETFENRITQMHTLLTEPNLKRLK